VTAYLLAAMYKYTTNLVQWASLRRTASKACLKDGMICDLFELYLTHTQAHTITQVKERIITNFFNVVWSSWAFLAKGPKIFRTPLIPNLGLDHQPILLAF
jgi:hypothetical protein